MTSLAYHVLYTEPKACIFGSSGWSSIVPVSQRAEILLNRPTCPSRLLITMSLESVKVAVVNYPSARPQDGATNYSFVYGLSCD